MLDGSFPIYIMRTSSPLRSKANSGQLFKSLRQPTSVGMCVRVLNEVASATEFNDSRHTEVTHTKSKTI